MDVDDRFATLQFFEDRLQHGIAQVHAVGVREQHNAMEDAKGFLEGLLADGPVNSTQVFKDARSAGKHRIEETCRTPSSRWVKRPISGLTGELPASIQRMVHTTRSGQPPKQLISLAPLAPSRFYVR